jgi:outer membrane protein
MRKKIIISAILALMAPTFSSVFAQEPNIEQDTKIWTLEDCLQYGLKNHPKVIMADHDVKIQEAALLSTKSSFDPKLSAGMNLGNSKDQRRGDVTSFHSNSSQSESLSLSKKLYDSGKYSLQKKQSKEALEAAKKDRETTLISLAANIKTMFFKAQQAQSILQVKLETLDGYEKHLKKVESFVEVGTHAPYDITKAQVNVANARVDLISAKSSLKQALVNMGNAIGIDHPIHVASYKVENLPEIDESVKDEYVKIALDRPEVKSSEAKLRSAKYRIKEAKTALKPSVSTSAGYSWNQTHTPQDRGWNVGLGVSWSLYDGRSTKASIDSAKSSYERTKASLDNLKLNIDSEVENGINDIIDSAQRVKANEILVKQTSESLELAESRYDTGLGSPLEITDARVDYEKAKGNLINAYFDCLIAQTKLDNTLGRMPKEYSLDKAVEELKDNKELDEVKAIIEPVEAEEDKR